MSIYEFKFDILSIGIFDRFFGWITEISMKNYRIRISIFQYELN